MKQEKITVCTEDQDFVFSPSEGRTLSWDISVDGRIFIFEEDPASRLGRRRIGAVNQDWLAVKHDK